MLLWTEIINKVFFIIWPWENGLLWAVLNLPVTLLWFIFHFLSCLLDSWTKTIGIFLPSSLASCSCLLIWFLLYSSELILIPPSLPTNRKMINYLLESVDKRRDFSNLHISVHDWLLPLQKYEWLAGALRVALWLLVRIVCVAMGSLDGGPEMFAPNGLVNILHVLTLSRRILKRRPKSRSWFITLYWLWLTHLPLVSENKRLCGAYKVYFYPMFLGLSWILAVLRSCDLWCVRKVQGAFVFFGCMVQLSV